MALSLLLVDVVGTGTRADPYRVPDVLRAQGSGWQQLFIDTNGKVGSVKQNIRMRALGVSPRTDLNGGAIRRLAVANTGAELVQMMRDAGVTGGLRTMIFDFTDGANLTRPPTSNLYATLEDIQGQIEPGVTMESKILSAG